MDPYNKNKVSRLKSLKLYQKTVRKRRNRKVKKKSYKRTNEEQRGPQKSNLKNMLKIPKKLQKLKYCNLLTGLSKRSRKIISDLKITSIEILKAMSYENLCKMQGCGKKSAAEIIKKLMKF